MILAFDVDFYVILFTKMHNIFCECGLDVFAP